MIMQEENVKLKILLKTKYKVRSADLQSLMYNVCTVKQLSLFTGKEKTAFYNALNRGEINHRHPFSAMDDKGPKLVAIDEKLIVFLKS